MSINDHGCWYPDEKPVNWTNEQYEWFKNRHEHDEYPPHDHGQCGDTCSIVPCSPDPGLPEH